MFKKIFSLVLACCFLNSLMAQELSLQFVPDLYQNVKINPALVPDQRLVIALPGIYGSYFHTPGSVAGLVNFKDKEGLLDVSKLLANVESTNFLKVNLELETVSVHFRVNDKFSLNLNHAVKSNSYLKYSDKLPQVFWEGNAQFIGQEVAFGPDQQSFAYNEIGLGAAYKIGKLTIGAKAKWLTGIGDISTDRTEASLYTDDDIYQLRLSTDYRINSSTFDDVLLFDTLSGYDVEYDLNDVFSFKNFTTENTGIAFDLGLDFEVNDKLSIGASIIDWGKIDWTKDITNFYSQGTSDFNGLDFSSVLSGDEVSISSAVDSIENIFKFKETNNDYSTSLAPKVYVNARYQLNERFTLGGLYYGEFYRGETFSAVAVSTQAKLLKTLTVGASYSIRNETYDNVGLSATYKLGPVQIYAVTDNVIAAIQPYKSKNVNLRLGLNLIFGSTSESAIE